MDSPAGSAFEGKYEVLEKLHEGGMGAVYKARHRLLEEIRVVKVVRPHMQGDTEFQQRFLREARTSVRLRHTNIAQIYDFSLDEQGMGYLVMEFIDGPNLLQVLKAAGPLPVEFVVAVGLQAALALDFLHRQDLIHRDISPDNLMLTRDYRDQVVTKLIDLGLARETEVNRGLTQTGVFLGKLSYASPEHFGGPTGKEQLEPRSDLYSLGVVFYQLLTGELPIRGSDFGTMLAGHLFHPPRGFDETDPGNRVPEKLRALILSMLAKGVDGRPASMEVVVRALRSLSGVLGDPADELVDHLLERRPAPSGEAPGSATRDKIGRRFALETTDIPASEGRPAVSSGREGAAGADETSATGPNKDRKSTTDVIRSLLEAGDLDAAETLLESARTEEPGREVWGNFEDQIRAVREATSPPTRRVSSEVKRQEERRRFLEERVGAAEGRLDDGEVTAAAEILGEIEKEEVADARAAAAIEGLRERLSSEIAEQQRRKALVAGRAEIERLLSAGDLEAARKHCAQVQSSVGADSEIDGLLQRIESEEDRRIGAVFLETENLVAAGDLEAAKERLRSLDLPEGHGARARRQSIREEIEHLEREAEEAAEAARRAEELRRREEEQKRQEAEEAKRQERERRAEEERQRAEEARQRAEEQKRQEAEEAKRQERERRAEEERQRAEEARRRAEEQKRQEAEEARQREQERRDEEARRAAEAERRRAEAERKKAEVAAARAAASSRVEPELDGVGATPRAPSTRKPDRARLAAAAAVVLLVGSALALWLSSRGGETDVPGSAGGPGTVLIDASPWARVVEILDEGGRTVEVPADGMTPLRFSAASATYSVRLEMPDGETVVEEVRVIEGEIVTVWRAAESADVDGLLSRIGFR